MATAPAPGAPAYGTQTYDTAPPPSKAYVSRGQGLIRSKMRKRKKKARSK